MNLSRSIRKSVEKERERKQERFLPFDCDAEGKFNTDAFSTGVLFKMPSYVRYIVCFVLIVKLRPPKRDSFAYRVIPRGRKFLPHVEQWIDRWSIGAPKFSRFLLTLEQ